MLVVVVHARRRSGHAGCVEWFEAMCAAFHHSWHVWQAAGVSIKSQAWFYSVQQAVAPLQGLLDFIIGILKLYECQD